MPTPNRAPERIRLEPADPFDLIRLIARSQSDPRKAIAELVQNSLDAGARHVRLTRFTHEGRRALSIWDDGQGVFPELPRDEALKRIATTIGRSYKRNLTLSERHQQMTLGKYGIGLLGFWSTGRVMEIRSRVRGSEVWILKLVEEERDGEVRHARTTRLPLEESFTEVVISDVHVAAEAQLQIRRLAAYLSGEMRGQLLQRPVKLELFDRVARGLAHKRIEVKPQRFQGVALDVARELAVTGFAAARVELYLVAEEEGRRGQVALACGGSTVLDDLATIDGTHGSDGGATLRAPWSSGRFEGVVDFPDLEVAPTTRRGFVPNAAAAAFLAALPTLEARCREILAQDAQRRLQEREADDANNLRRLFRRLARSLPQYSLFSLRRESGSEPGEIEGGDDAAEVAAPPDAEIADGEPAGDPAAASAFLFAPGPLATVEIRPKRSVLAPGAARRLKAIARDEAGQEITSGVAFEWSLEGAGTLAADAADPAVATWTAPFDPVTTSAKVCARQEERVAQAVAELRVSEQMEPPDVGDQGVPDPQPVHDAGGRWRSRVFEGRWEYNTSHGDYRAVQDDPKRRLRYLVHLFAKEVVQRNFGGPQDGELLEHMVEVLTYVGEPSVLRKAEGRAPASPPDVAAT